MCISVIIALLSKVTLNQWKKESFKKEPMTRTCKCCPDCFFMSKLILPVQNSFDFTFQNTKFIWFYLSKNKIYFILPVKIQNSFELFDFTYQNTKFTWSYLSKYKILSIYLILCHSTKLIWFYLSKYKIHLIFFI